MGTKNNPGAFDCYAKADPDEPIFTLRAKDRTAPHFVLMWEAVQRADMTTACEQLLAAVKKREFKDLPDFDDPKMTEARACADSMEDWRENMDLAGRQQD